MVDAGSGRYELAAGVRIRLDDVRGPDWSATRMMMTTGPVRFAAGPDPSLRCVDIDVVARLRSGDLARGVQHLPIAGISIDDGSVTLRPSGRLAPFTFGVVPRFHEGRVVLEARTIAWRSVRVALPTPLARRWTRWIDPPAWLGMDGLRMAGDSVEIRGRIDRWVHPISLETIQMIAAAAQRRGQDLVLPRRPASSD